MSEERLPTFSSLAETWNPATSVGKVTSEMPPYPSSPVRTASVRKSARHPFEIQVFEPLMTRSPPSRRARVRMRGHVAAGVGLGDGQRRDLLPAERRGQELALLLVGPELPDDGRGHLALDQHPGAEPPVAGADQLLRVGHHVPVVEAGAPPGRVVADAQEAHLPEPAEEVAGKFPRLVPGAGVRGELLLREVADHAAEGLVLVGEGLEGGRGRVHRRPSLLQAHGGGTGAAR